MMSSGYLAYDSNGKSSVDKFADQFSKWMAYNELAGDPRYQGIEAPSDEQRERIEKNAEQMAENIRESRSFQEMFKPENVRESIETICGKKETWKQSDPYPLDYDTEKEKLNEKFRRFDEQREQKRTDTKGLVERLKGTTSKSFAGRLKSFFVGNSKEYDKAFEAMQKFSEGKLSPDKAKEAI